MASKEKLPYIILGLLKEAPLSGYDLKIKFEQEIGEFWQAKTSQIYPSLKTLLEDGAVELSQEIVGARKKKIYHITEKGRTALAKWMLSPIEEFPVQKDEFMLRLYFQKKTELTELRSLIMSELVMHQSKLYHLQERQKILFDTPEKIAEDHGHFLILDYAIKREQFKIDWLNTL